MYDELASLFNLDKDDKRPRLFLHILLQTVTSRPLERLVYHGNGLTWARKDGLEEDDIDPELQAFVLDLEEAINNRKMNNEAINKQNDILNKYSSIANIDRLAKLVGATPDGKRYNAFTKADFEQIKKSFRIDASFNPEYVKSYRKKTMFTYKIDKATAQGMLEDTKNEATPVASTSTFLASFDAPSNTYTYFRDSKDPSKLYTKDDAGKLVEVTRGSAKFWEESKENCAGFHVAKNDKASCSYYLIDCINGSDPTKCRKYMDDTTFWGNDENGIKEEVKQMLPAMALTTLEKFGFKQVNVVDSVAKKSLNKVESVTTWLERLRKDMSSNLKEYTKIESNTNLTLYLNLLVEKINGSPHILNEKIAESEETQPYNPSKFNGSLLSSYGLKPKLPSGSNIVSSMSRLSDTMKYGLTATATLQPKVIVAVNPGFVMRGGADNIQEDYKFTAVELENQYNLLKNMLKAHGKEIDSSNDLELKALFSSFKTTENKLWQTIKIMNKYVELMDAFSYNDPNKVLNLETLNEIVKAHEHQLTKTSKKQETIVQALQTLADVVQEAVNKSGATKSATGVPTSTPFTHHN
jgi:hypothetical protein